MYWAPRIAATTRKHSAIGTRGMLLATAAAWAVCRTRRMPLHPDITAETDWVTNRSVGSTMATVALNSLVCKHYPRAVEEIKKLRFASTSRPAVWVDPRFGPTNSDIYNPLFAGQLAWDLGNGFN